MSLSPFNLRRGLRDQRGFTLVETLVAMVTGLIVTGALFAILEFTVRQTSRISQVAQASQVSRTAMTHIVDELHSACLSTGFSPVQEKSSPTTLIFQNGYSEEAEVPGVYTAKGGSTGAKNEGVRQDEIEWNEGKKELVDKVALGTGPEAEGKYPVGTPTSVRLATNVTQGELQNAKSEMEVQPIFRYYKFSTTSATNTAAAAATLEPITIATGKSLNKTEAESVSSVEIRFKTGSYHKEVNLKKGLEAGIPNEVLTQNTFAFSAPNSEATIAAGPCE